MEWPDDLVPILPYLRGDTAAAWVKLATVVPASAYLIGGTALSVHLRHRVSRDLDFALAEPEDIPAVRERIERVGLLAVTKQDDGTLNGIFERTKIQVLDTWTQQLLVEPTVIAGMKVVGVEDIAAMNLMTVVRSLGYLDDVEPGPALPVTGGDIARYWTKRQPQVLRNLSRW